MEKILEKIVANLKKYVPVNVFRGGQKTFYQKIRQAVIDGNRTMYIQGPTGMGKSFIQSTIADAIINSTDIKGLLLVPKITLLSQMRREFVKFAKHLTIGLVGDGLKDHSKQVTVMTYQSFLNKDQSVLSQYSFIFLDEAHKALGEKTRAKVDQQTHALIIGFTATSYYNENKNLKEWLGLEVHKVSITEAVKVGMISGIQLIIGKVKIKVSDRARGEKKKAYEKRIASDIIRQGGNIAAARIYKKLFSAKGSRFIMFTLTVDQGHDLVRELREQGVCAGIIHGDLKTKERERLFKSFAKGEFKVLVGIDVIKEGFDDPGVHGALFAYPIGSLLGLEQGAGRATRIDEMVPDKVAFIVQLMFDGRHQVWYQDILEGSTIVLPPGKLEDSENPELISAEELGDVADDIIESVAVETDEVRRLVREYAEAFSHEMAPPGWMTARSISMLPRIVSNPETIKKIAESFRFEQPGWFSIHVTSNNSAEHYDPELVKILVEKCARKDVIPEGWATANNLYKDPRFPIGPKRLKELAEKYRPKHPEWFSRYITGKHFVECYALPLVEKLAEECGKRKSAPPGWMTAKRISGSPEVAGNGSKVRDLAEGYRKNHPKWFSEFFTGTLFVEHYHPDLVKILIKEGARKKKPPEGWMTAKSISGLPGVVRNHHRIKKVAESHRAKKPKWFNLYAAGTNFTEYYHSDLVKILKEKCARKE